MGKWKPKGISGYAFIRNTSLIGDVQFVDEDGGVYVATLYATGECKEFFLLSAARAWVEAGGSEIKDTSDWTSFQDDTPSEEGVLYEFLCVETPLIHFFFMRAGEWFIGSTELPREYTYSHWRKANLPDSAMQAFDLAGET